MTAMLTGMTDLTRTRPGGNLSMLEGTPTAGPNDNKMFEVKITDRTPKFSTS